MNTTTPPQAPTQSLCSAAFWYQSAARVMSLGTPSPEPMGVTARQLAADIDVPPSRISELVHGKRPITADTALRLGLFFKMEPRFWLNLQSEYDMRLTTREHLFEIAPRIRVLQPLAA